MIEIKHGFPKSYQTRIEGLKDIYDVVAPGTYDPIGYVIADYRPNFPVPAIKLDVYHGNETTHTSIWERTRSDFAFNRRVFAERRDA